MNSDSSFKEGVSWWGETSLDMLSIRGPAERFNRDVIKTMKCKGVVNITDAGGSYKDINLHAEGLVPYYPVIKQVGVYFMALTMAGAFDSRLSLSMQAMLLPEWDWDEPRCIMAFIATLNYYGFRWVRHEVAYDFQTGQRPIKVKDPKDVTEFRGTQYSPDESTQFREVVRKSVVVKDSKGHRDSLVCVYDRGKKILTINPLRRIEFRLSRHHLDRLTMIDWCLDFHSWVLFRQPFLVKCMRRAVRPKSWAIRQGLVGPQHWRLKELIEAAEWEVF